MELGDNPSNWKWGIFYYNKQDNRLFPPKRYGFGWTINFANPNSVFFFVAILILIFAYNFFYHGTN